MHEAPGRKWTVEELTEVAGQSRSAFANVFKRETGVAPTLRGAPQTVNR